MLRWTYTEMFLSMEAWVMSGDLVMQPGAAIKIKNIDPVDSETNVQIGGDLHVNPGKLFSSTTSPRTFTWVNHLVLRSMVYWI